MPAATCLEHERRARWTRQVGIATGVAALLHIGIGNLRAPFMGFLALGQSPAAKATLLRSSSSVATGAGPRSVDVPRSSSLAAAIVGVSTAAVAGAFAARRDGPTAGRRASGLTSRRGRGFSDNKIKHKRKTASLKELIEHHGEAKAKAVHAVLMDGEPAKDPEDMVRARYSAVRLRDAVFMAKTEIDPQYPKLDRRVRSWALSFGEEPRTEADGAVQGPEKLMYAQNLTVISASGKEVEFKIDCGEQGTLHERSIMTEDDKYGFIYSGETVFDEWIDPPGAEKK